MRTFRLLILLAFMLGAGTTGARASAPGTPAATPAGGSLTISLGATPTGAPIPPTIVGANHRWPFDGLGMWSPTADAPDPTLVEYAKRAGLGMVRYPGGTVANLFDWKAAIGPIDQRGCQVGGGFVGDAEPMDSDYGPDEHQRFVGAIGAQTMMMAPATVTSPEDLADFVEYMNAPVGTNPNGGTDWAAVRAKNGHPLPYGVKVWEVGNEPYLKNQRYWRSSDPTTALRQYAFGGTQTQYAQPVGTRCDHRPPAAASSGKPGQAFQVWYPPVVPQSQTIYVGGDAWTEVRDLRTSGPRDHVYRFAPQSGTITFGDGTHGAIPPIGDRITADYDSGPHPGFVQYAKAMKAVDPTIAVCSGWGRPEFVTLMAGKSYDCIGVHAYGTIKTTGDPAVDYERIVSAAGPILDRIDTLRAEIERHFPHDRRPYIEVSEYGLFGTGPRWSGSLAQAIFMAELERGFITRGIPIALVSNLNANHPTPGELFGGAPDFCYTARAEVSELFSRLVGLRPVKTAIARPPENQDAPRVLAARGDRGRTAVMIINPDRTLPISGALDVGKPADQTITAMTLDAGAIDATNCAGGGDPVPLRITKVADQGGTVTVTFPAHSVTLLEFSPGFD